MTVAKYKAPTQSADTFPEYKNNIDASVRVLAERSTNFAPHEAATPNMTIIIDPGKIFDGVTVSTVASSVTASATAPSANPRIDRYVIDNTGAYSVVTGTEAASPVAPDIPKGKWPICQVAMVVSQTTIQNSDITDERVGEPIFTPLMDAALVTEAQVSATASTVYAVDCSQGSLFVFTLTAASCVISFTNVPASTKTATITLILVQDATGSRVPVFPASVLWDGGTVPTWGTTSGNEDVITLFTYDSGATWRANLVGQNYA